MQTEALIAQLTRLVKEHNMTEENRVENFGDSLKRLEEIVRELEGGRLELEDSLKIYEEGVALIAKLNERLKTAELKVNSLLGELGEVEDD